jgi:hypothetical protein
LEGEQTDLRSKRDGDGEGYLPFHCWERMTQHHKIEMFGFQTGQKCARRADGVYLESFQVQD